MAPSFGDASNEMGITLATARAALGITQNELHKRTGISREAIKGYESGRNKPGAREIKLLCEALQITPNSLLFGSEQPFESSGEIYELMQGDGRFDLIKIGVLFELLTHKEKESIVFLIHSIAQTRHNHDELKRRIQEASFTSALVTTMISIANKVKSGELKSDDVLGEFEKQIEQVAEEIHKKVG